MEAVTRINTQAPIEVVEALMSSVIRSVEKKIALITSQVGARKGSKKSLGLYGDSKAALNDRFRGARAKLASERLSRGGDPPGLGTHRHGRRQCPSLGRAERLRHPPVNDQSLTHLATVVSGPGTATNTYGSHPTARTGRDSYTLDSDGPWSVLTRWI